MATSKLKMTRASSEKGASILIIAASMVFILGMAGLGIDLGSLYVGRNQAQRAADAAALAGAKAFIDSGYSAGLVGSGVAQTWATDRAKVVGDQNLIAGVNANIQDSDISFDFATSGDPRITVVAARDTAHSNAMPTFFMKIFGINTANVSAKATAEAYNPTGNSVPVGAKCIKPWLLPNCDPNSLHEGTQGASLVNPACAQDSSTGGYPYYLITPGTSTTPAAITLDSPAPAGSLGEQIVIKPGDPSQIPTPGKFYPVFLPPGSVATECPACANGSGTSGGSGSGALYRTNIECCNTNLVVCGPNATIQAIGGNMNGPTAQGVDCLIHQNSGGTGQDTINTSTTPFQILAGPDTATSTGVSVGTQIFDSDSLVTVPVYNGSILCPGGSSGGTCQPSTVNIVGFAQLFVQNEITINGSGGGLTNVNAYIMNISACAGGVGGSGGGGSPPPGGGGGTVVSSGGSPIPVRLIHQ